MLDLLGGLGAALRQAAHFRCDHREAAALFTRARRLDGRIQRQDVGLEGNGVNHADDVVDLARAFGDLLHALDHLHHHVAAALGGLGGRRSQLIGLARGVGRLGDRGRQLFHAGRRFLKVGCGLLRAGRQVLVAGGDLRGRSRNGFHARAHLADHAAQVGGHGRERAQQVAQFVLAFVAHVDREVARGDGIRDAHRLVQRTGDGAYRQRGQHDADQQHHGSAGLCNPLRHRVALQRLGLDLFALALLQFNKRFLRAYVLRHGRQQLVIDYALRRLDIARAARLLRLGDQPQHDGALGGHAFELRLVFRRIGGIDDLLLHRGNRLHAGLELGLQPLAEQFIGGDRSNHHALDSQLRHAFPAQRQGNAIFLGLHGLRRLRVELHRHHVEACAKGQKRQDEAQNDGPEFSGDRKVVEVHKESVGEDRGTKSAQGISTFGAVNAAQKIACFCLHFHPKQPPGHFSYVAFMTLRS